MCSCVELISFLLTEADRKYVIDTLDFKKIMTRSFIKLFLLQGKAPEEIHIILKEILGNLHEGYQRQNKGCPV